MPNGAQDTLSRVIWGEARGEGVQGMTAVACVVLNRAANPSWWGKDIVTVCLKPWQFSCLNANDPNKDKLLQVTLDDPQFAEAWDIAGQAVAGTLQDITNHADSYYVTDSQEPKWAVSKTPCAVIGKHSFFRTV